MRVFGLLFLWVCRIGFVLAQVQNNSIKDRIKLELDAPPLHTSTAKSTVEWECVNKALTNKCLVYHNDQWYYFSLAAPGTHYLNISAQQCRDRRGVQIIIIEGNPCETSSYRILQCIPKITNEEIFVPLGELKANTTYLIEVDGFLGDYCEFGIQIGTKPSGMPMETKGLETLDVVLRQVDKRIQLEWKLPAEKNLSIGGFKVYKSQQPFVRFDLEREVPLERNAYGLPVRVYTMQDTVEESGVYKYRVFGLRGDNHVPFLYGENLVSYHEKRMASANPQNSQKTSIPLDCKTATEFEVLIYEQGSHVLLTQFKRECPVKGSPLLEIDFSEYVTKGFASFLVLIVRATEKEGKEYYFTVDTKGTLKRN